ncbi:MAG: glycosyltransferase [Bacteroidales bacterium]|nr:glycosyltransferase [Bacteroidales bacterium]
MKSRHQLHALVCPLDWGLGHASRCVPLIQELLSQGFKVSIAGQGNSLELLAREFPELERFSIRGFSPTYSKSGNMTGKMLGLIPSFIFYTLYENYILSRIVKVQKIDLIISDNRYGIINKKTKNILLLHQLQIQPPANAKWIGIPINLVNKLLIRRFDECWIPDYEGDDNLGGILSHPERIPSNVSYIGPLSRLDKVNDSRTKNQILAILSGPEPERSNLESILIRQLTQLNKKSTIISGKPDEKIRQSEDNNLSIIAFADTKMLNELISQSEIIICRSGYSSIMDLDRVGGKALLIPTPGQTEQEYLAERIKNQGIAYSIEQNQLKLDTDIPIAMTFNGFKSRNKQSILSTRMESLKSSLLRTSEI